MSGELAGDRAPPGALWLDAEGSTRQLGIMRAALAMLLWTTWGFPFILQFGLDPLRLALALSFYIASWLLFFGLWSRASAAVVAVSLLVVIVVQGDAAPEIWRLQHRQLTAALVIILAFSPCGRALSVDRLGALRRASTRGLPPPDERGPLWTLRVLQLLATAVFVTTALHQMSPEWLGGAAFARLGALSPPAWAPALARGMLLVNLVGAIGPWFRRTRTASIWLVSSVYVALFPFMDADTLPLIVVFLLFSFVSPARVHGVIDRLHGVPAPSRP